MPEFQNILKKEIPKPIQERDELEGLSSNTSVISDSIVSESIVSDDSVSDSSVSIDESEENKIRSAPSSSEEEKEQNPDIQIADEIDNRNDCENRSKLINNSTLPLSK